MFFIKAHLNIFVGHLNILTPRTKAIEMFQGGMTEVSMANMFMLSIILGLLGIVFAFVAVVIQKL